MFLENCLNSLRNQTNTNYKVVLVDYGSSIEFKNKLTRLISNYPFVSLIRCETNLQLWCKSRAINIALKQQDWLRLISEIQKLSEAEKKLTRWRYWLARLCVA